ncbi:TetR/AcrR family transcriptional regulator [Alkalicella caledoniensis]|uniref:TetR/AcrR family transcriptional regulator n=1 Tax=Alkalicella caledoniensis TaxID=2731377 RepID=A0A7G9W9P8_ALKCA|nr:TetR/AcrR family transcriptional regulator [Alkalicella caledoniensis]QNO15410.1 TetR/AcrR family transcriptional regulator [Alkalicella caledoniensis]
MDSKDKILNAALKLFIREGFHGTSTAKIANEAGISNGTLFHHFKTKEDLINRLYISVKENYKNYLLGQMEPCETTKGKIKQLWNTCVRWNLENKDGATFFAMFANSPYIDKLSKEEASRNFTFISELFQESIDAEVLISVNPNLMISSFHGSVKAFVSFIANNPENLDLDEHIDIAFKMWWRSVANI